MKRNPVADEVSFDGAGIGLKQWKLWRQQGPRQYMDWIHKPGTPLRPIVSFYDTPLSALYKQLWSPSQTSGSKIKLPWEVQADIDGQYPYYCSLDVKSLYTSCDMHKAVDTVMENLKKKPELITKEITPEAIKSLLIFSLDNSYFEFNNTLSGGRSPLKS